MKRRDMLIASASLFVSPSAFAQMRSRAYRIGFLAARSRPVSWDGHYFGAFRKGMRELGYVEGNNLVIEWRFAEGNYERLPALAADLVSQDVDVIVAAASPAIRAAQRATTTIPIVFPTTGDPLGSGFVASLARPGGNITGLTDMHLDTSAKLLELLTELLPGVSRVAVMSNPGSSTQSAILKSIQAAAQKTKLQLLLVQASTPDEIQKGFAAMIHERPGALIVVPDAFLNSRAPQIATLAVKQRLPSVTQPREYAEAGGLMSYGADLNENYRRAATYVDRILKGEKPAEMPVEQPTKFELVVNMKTAKALGVTMPRSILLRADRVIE